MDAWEQWANAPHLEYRWLVGADPGINTDDETACEGHYDDDFTLTSGAGIGEPTYCNGSCVSR